MNIKQQKIKYKSFRVSLEVFYGSIFIYTESVQKHNLVNLMYIDGSFDLKSPKNLKNNKKKSTKMLHFLHTLYK